MGAWRGAVAAGLALGVLVSMAGCATVQIQDARVVTGSVTDQSGAPVPNSPVVVVGRSFNLAPTRLEYEQTGQSQEARTTTDGQGRYRLEFVPASLGNNFYLFFYDKTGFDGVKYDRPEPLDITKLLDRDQTVTVNQVLRFSPAWPEIERQIAFYGPSSDRGKILRQNGLPDKREPTQVGGPNSEVWWYYAYGISYWFTGDTLTSTQTFPPTPGGASR